MKPDVYDQLKERLGQAPQQRRAVQRELAKRSLYSFLKMSWAHVEKRPYIDNWHVKCLCDHLQAVTEGRVNDLIINTPPGLTLSYVMNVFWPVWEWGPRGLSQTKWDFYAESIQVSRRDAYRRRKLMYSLLYRELWGIDLTRRGSIAHLENDFGGVFQALVVGKHSDTHPERIVVDSPHSREVKRRNESRDNQWWRAVSSFSVGNPARVLGMSRVSRSDMTDTFLSMRHEKLCHVIIPAEFVPEAARETAIGWKDPRTLPGEVAWADVYTPQQLADAVAGVTEYEAACLYQQMPPKPAVDTARSAGESDDEAIQRASQSPKNFREMIYIETNSGERVRFSDILDDWQRDDFEAMDAAWLYMARVSRDRPQKRRAYLERPRGHSKTTDQAVMATWAVLAGKTKLNGYIFAGSGKQAEELYSQIGMVMRMNPWLERRLRLYVGRLVNTETESVCHVVEADAGGIMGQRPNFALCDEVTHWKDEKKWNAAVSGLLKTPDAICVVIANAGYGKGRSWQWKLRERLRVDPVWYFHSLPGPIASWIGQDELEEARRIIVDHNEYRRLVLNKWLSDSKEGIPYEQIVDRTVLAGPRTARSDAWDFVIGGLDIGRTGDRTSLVLVAGITSQDKLQVINHYTFSPADYPEDTVKLADVESVIVREHKRLDGLFCVYADTSQAGRTAEILMDEHGIDCQEVFYTAKFIAQQCRDLTDAFRTKWIELYYDEILEADILSLEVQYNEFSKTGKLTAERNEFGHADSGFALAIAVAKGKQLLDEWRGLLATEIGGQVEVDY